MDINNLDEAQGLISKAMKNVMQELMIIDGSGNPHLVYIMGLRAVDGKMVIDYSSINGESEELDKLVYQAMDAQIQQIMQEEKPTWLKQFWSRCCSTMVTLWRRIPIFGKTTSTGDRTEKPSN